ncbi:MAG: Na+/H+ antiporter subunit E [Eubacteriales bacterium]
MKNKRTILFYGVVGAVVFCVLLGKIVLWGIVVGFVSGMCLDILMAKIQSVGGRVFLEKWFLKYYLLLLKDMFVSAIKVCRSVFCKNQPEIMIVRLKTHTGNKGKVLVSNSISLTPGTITLEQEADSYHILYMDLTDKKEDMLQTAKVFEKRMEEKVDS